MGAVLACCRAPAAAQHDGEKLHQGGTALPDGQAALSAAAAASGQAGSPAANPAALCSQPPSVVSGYHSAADGYASDGDEEVWHDALSELNVDLAEELERWEEQTLQGRDTSVDAAIEVGCCSAWL